MEEARWIEMGRNMVLEDKGRLIPREEKESDVLGINQVGRKDSRGKEHHWMG